MRDGPSAASISRVAALAPPPASSVRIPPAASRRGCSSFPSHTAPIGSGVPNARGLPRFRHGARSNCRAVFVAAPYLTTAVACRCSVRQGGLEHDVADRRRRHRAHEIVEARLVDSRPFDSSAAVTPSRVCDDAAKDRLQTDSGSQRSCERGREAIVAADDAEHLLAAGRAVLGELIGQRKQRQLVRICQKETAQADSNIPECLRARGCDRATGRPTLRASESATPPSHRCSLTQNARTSGCSRFARSSQPRLPAMRRRAPILPDRRESARQDRSPCAIQHPRSACRFPSGFRR